MGTRGYYIIKWRGVYYVFYNQWDSYPSGLGRILVFLLRNVWCKMTDSQFNTFLLNKLAKGLPSQRSEVCVSTDFNDLLNESFIEFTYVIDMDNDTIMGVPFNQFFSNWEQILFADSEKEK